MIERIISDCEQALDHNLYFAALSLALTLPDICAKAKYPNEKSNKKRYVDWYEEYIGQHQKHPQLFEESDDFPYASGQIIYSLRCSLLHQGTPNIDGNKCNVTHFSLICESKKPPYAWEMSGTSPGRRELQLPIRTICETILTAVKKYYTENKERFNFFNYHLIDWDEVIEQQIKMGNPPQYIEYLNKGENKDQT